MPGTNDYLLIILKNKFLIVCNGTHEKILKKVMEKILLARKSTNPDKCIPLFLISSS